MAYNNSLVGVLATIPLAQKLHLNTPYAKVCFDSCVYGAIPPAFRSSYAGVKFRF